MSDFYSNLKQTVDNVSITENGAVGYKTAGHALVDFNFKVSSYRNALEKAIEDFKKVLSEKEPYALRYFFYLRDAREGIGERDTSRTILKTLIEAPIENKDEIVDFVINKIPEFGRYDDLFVFFGTEYENKVLLVLKNQLKEDFENYKNGKPVSLLAKWLPSENASSKKTKIFAHKFIDAFKTTPREYRKTLSALREYLDLTEVKACAKKWDEIDYNTVPSKANIKYANAFLRNDETRRRQYLADLNRGVDAEGKVVKMNSSVNTPHDVLHLYRKDKCSYDITLDGYDETIEQLWKNLKEVEGLKDTIVVRDDSGSMLSCVGKTNITAYEVATALGIYCAEHNSAAYKNKIITFSATPRYLDFSDEKKYGSLYSKYKFLREHSEVANTNIEAVFDLILKTAVENKLDASELPAQILILSDMEFDSSACSNHTVGRYYWESSGVDISLFNTIAAKYATYGYKIPKLIFWNLNSRTGTIPCKENDLGVILVSGFSQNVLNLVNSGKTDPYDALVDHLNAERYAEIPLLSYSEKTAKKATGRSAKKKETPDFLK